MGLLEHVDVRKLDRTTFGQVLQAISGSGVGSAATAAWVAASGRLERAELESLLESLTEGLETSPVPEHEWQAVERVLGISPLASLLGVAPVTVRRYRAGARQTPDEVAARLHLLAAVVGDLAGAYNEIGVRRWFERPRAALGGRTPTALLSGDWSPDDAGPLRVRELARSITASPAT